jgi:threonine synthase
VLRVVILGGPNSFEGRVLIGSAAIYGLRGKKDVDVFILHPHKRISPIQEAQMTTVLDENVHNLAVNGTFDDCQVTHP